MVAQEASDRSVSVACGRSRACTQGCPEAWTVLCGQQLLLSPEDPVPDSAARGGERVTSTHPTLQLLALLGMLHLGAVGHTGELQLVSPLPVVFLLPKERYPQHYESVVTFHHIHVCTHTFGLLMAQAFPCGRGILVGPKTEPHNLFY